MARRARWVAGSVIALVAVTAIAHTPYGLRAIAWMTGSDGCPFGGDPQRRLTADAAERQRVERLARGSEPAPARPALGFQLDVDRREDVLAWAERNRIACRSDRSGAGLRCERVAGAALPAALADVTGVVAFGFDPGDHLVSVQFQSASGTPRARVLALAGEAMAGLEQLGQTASTGDPLASGSFIHRQTRARFTDYSAEVIASSVGKRWMMVQTFQSIPAVPRG